MKPIKGRKQTKKMKGYERMEVNSEIHESGNINPAPAGSQSNDEKEQIKRQLQMIRRPKSGKSL